MLAAQICFFLMLPLHLPPFGNLSVLIAFSQGLPHTLGSFQQELKKKKKGNHAQRSFLCPCLYRYFNFVSPANSEAS